MYKVIMARQTHYPQMIDIEKDANTVLDEDFHTKTYLKSVWLYREMFDDKINNDKLVLCVAIDGDSKGPDKVCGYAAYKYNKKNKAIDVVKLEGVNEAVLNLIKHISTKKEEMNSINLEPYSNILFASHDRRLSQHLFMKQLGFKATKVLKNRFEDGDAYLFVLENGK